MIQTRQDCQSCSLSSASCGEKNDHRSKIIHHSEAQTVKALVNALSAPSLGEAITNKLELLFRLAARAEAKVFVVNAPHGRWCVCAVDSDSVDENSAALLSLDEFQSRLHPDSLWGKCAQVHDYAFMERLADGVAIAASSISVEAIYGVNGFHQIGYRDSAEKAQSLYFDLTARAYLFTPTGASATHSVAAGLVMIDTLGSVCLPKALYAAEWQRFTPTPLSLETFETYQFRFGR